MERSPGRISTVGFFSIAQRAAVAARMKVEAEIAPKIEIKRFARLCGSIAHQENKAFIVKHMEADRMAFDDDSAYWLQCRGR